MFKSLVLIFLLLSLVSCKRESNNKGETNNFMESKAKGSIHRFIVKDIKGETFDMSQLKGKKVMIVNTASKCGLTGQYNGLQKLYETYKDEGFVILGFPANNFMSQEPGTNDEIQAFCERNYGVSFPMMGKISVKGPGKHVLYKYLTEKEENGVDDYAVSWNFQKFLLNKEGEVSAVFDPQTSPLDQAIIDWIEGNDS